jgi:hypothetical protein
MKITGWPASVLFVAALLTTGCEPPRYEVSGRISYADGSPFAAPGFVVAEGEADGRPVMARSTIRPDGTFLLAGRNEHEGMLAGRYRLRLIPPRGVGDASIDDPGVPQLPFDRRFLDFETSGLTCEVGPDSGEIQIDLGTKPGRN